MVEASSNEQTPDPKVLNAWLKSQKGHSQGRLSKAIALGSVNGLLMIGQTALLAFLIDSLLLNQSQPSALVSWAIGGLIALIFIRAMFGYFSECYSRRGAIAIKSQLRKQLLQRLFQLGPAYTQNHGSAKLAHLLQQGVDSLEDYFAGYLPVVAYCSVIPLAILIAVFPVDWQSGLILLLTAPMVPFFMILIGHKAQKLNQQHWSKLLRMSSHFLDIIQGLTQLKLFNASRREIAAVKKISDDYGDQTMAILKVAFLSSFFLEFLASISIALVAVILGFRLYYDTVDYVLALWVLLLAPEFYLPFRQLGAQYHAKMAGVSAAADMVDLLQQPHLAQTPTSSNCVSSGSVNPASVNSTSALPFNAPFRLEFLQLQFSYPNRSAALTDINLVLEGPGIYAVIGESGAGKSTLIELILGFISASEGQLLINNQRLTGANRDNWLQHCGWIAQQGHIFYGSLAFNVAMSDDFEPARVIKALQQAGLNGFVMQLELGINSHVGEGGAGLSGGQAQRLALARAFYQQPAVLILDEPSSHLDQDTEQIVSGAINQYAQDHLVIVIAHRLSTVVGSKQIIVLGQGQVIEQGNHQQLLELGGYYAAMLSLDLGSDPKESHSEGK